MDEFVHVHQPEESVAERWPQARLTTAAAATGLGQSAAGGIPAQPEALADVGGTLSSEWKLALADERAFVERKPAREASAAGARANGQAAPASASASVPAPVPQAGTPPVPVELASATQLDLQHGISVRVYRSGPDLRALLAECDRRGFFSRGTCKAEVCRPYVGAVAECPLPEQVILN